MADNGVGTTLSLSVGGSSSSSIESLGEHDWYKINLSAGQAVDISITLGTLQDSYLNVRDSSGNILYSNDDIIDGINRASEVKFNPTYTGTYYIDVSGWVDPNQGSGDGYTGTGTYTVSAKPFTPPPLATNDQIANQLTNGYWGGDYHHWSVTQGGTLAVDIHTLTAAEQTLALAALQEWTDIIGIKFQQVTSGADITFDDGGDPTGNNPIAQTNANWSNHIITSANVEISKSWVTQYGTTLDSYSFQTYIHEIGHALGLGHAGDYNTTATFPYDAAFENDSWATSIMSYFSQHDNTYFKGLGFSDVYAVTPMSADIIAMQQLYGLSTTTRAGDTVYGDNSNAGGIYNAINYADVAYTIYDSGGDNTIDYSLSSANQLINLNPETFSNVNGYTGNLEIARGVLVQNAIGGSGNDTLIANSANDVLSGGPRADTLEGGAGNDIFKDTEANHNGDTITGFHAGDSLLFTDASLSNFTYSLSGNTLTYSGGSLTLDGNPSGQFAVTAVSAGVELILNNTIYGYDSQGQLVSATIYNSDGSHSYIAVDAAGTQSWNQEWFNYNAQGQLTSEDIRNDDASHTFIALDAANTQSWAQEWLSYDAQGRLVSEDIREDDGSHTFIAIDALDAQSWGQEWLNYNPQGQLTSEDIRNDDGTHTFIAVDASGTQTWTQEWFNYDAQGLVTEDIRNRDGSHTFISMDAGNSEPWAQAWFNYGPQGQHINEALVWDDGHVTYSSF